MVAKCPNRIEDLHIAAPDQDDSGKDNPTSTSVIHGSDESGRRDCGSHIPQIRKGPEGTRWDESSAVPSWSSTA